MHDDHIGALQLPAGHYAISVFDSASLSCSHASDLFRQFLEDWDGRLPGGWKVNVAAASFTRGTQGFSVAQTANPAGGGGGGRFPASGTSCPGFFRVLHNDRIGDFKVSRGRYRITLLAVGRLTCDQASSLFASFLKDFDGILRSPWIVDSATGTFLRGSIHVGFRVKPASGKPTDPDSGSDYPNDGTACPGFFRVLNDDRIGRLDFPAGPYRLTILRASKQISCRQASRLMTRFLQDPDGRLPAPWVLNRQRGAFTRGKGKKTGFRAKPMRSAAMNAAKTA